MSATDELRGGLRELGVQYQACGDSFTMWKHDGKTATYAEYPEGGKLKAFVTPAQAIAATVGASGRESYDAGFVNGVKAALQQLYGLLHEYPTLDEIEAWADSQWEVVA
jgi:hypothetical protein